MDDTYKVVCSQSSSTHVCSQFYLDTLQPHRFSWVPRSLGKIRQNARQQILPLHRISPYNPHIQHPIRRRLRRRPSRLLQHSRRTRHAQLTIQRHRHKIQHIRPTNQRLGWNGACIFDELLVKFCGFDCFSASSMEEVEAAAE